MCRQQQKATDRLNAEPVAFVLYSLIGRGVGEAFFHPIRLPENSIAGNHETENIKPEPLILIINESKTRAGRPRPAEQRRIDFGGISR